MDAQGIALLSTDIIGRTARNVSPKGAHDDVATFRQFLAGDDAAFAALFDRHHHRLHIYCTKFLGDSDAAADVAQELWERVIRMRTEPREVHNPGGLFLRMARNLCLNALKRGRRFSSIETLPEADHPAEDAAGERSELEEAIEVGLARLSFEHREVLVLNAYCGYKFEEIAEMMGKRPEAIWMRASRARARLRAEVIEQIGLRHAADSGPASGRRTAGRKNNGNDDIPMHEEKSR